MEYNFAKRVMGAANTAIRAVGEYAAGKPDFILFSIGNPAYETFPIEKIAKMNELVYSTPQNCRDALLYGSNYGPLVSAISARMTKYKDINMEENALFISAGSGPALDLMPATFCEPGDQVIVEEYAYTGGLAAIRSAECEAVGIPMEDDGMCIQALEEALKNNDRVRYIYLVPTFSNPTGITYSLEKRKAIYELACKYDVMIYEDDPYADIRFSGEYVPTIKSLDKDGRVVYAGSFSKVLAAGLRVGFIVAAKPVAAKMSFAQGNRAGATYISQMIVANFMEHYDFDAHLADIRKIYGEKAALMKECLDKEMPACCTRTDPDGGMFIWVTLPEGLDGATVFQALLENNIGVVPASGFAAGDPDAPYRSFRVNYSAPTKDEIVRGCKRFGEVLHRFCDK